MAGGSDKNKMVAALLAFFLGAFGVHHFYLGSTTAGIVCIAVTWLTCGIGGILPFIEFIMLLVMSDADFNAKYNLRTPQPMEFVFTKPT
ncbi:MAG: TM2 domain-containing protein [Planctomycetales bacterium]|nr:TM2 domain-containing protein [Planctomycetales bacterium]